MESATSFLSPLLKYLNRVSIVEESRIVRLIFDKDIIEMVEGAYLYVFENGRRRQDMNIYPLRGIQSYSILIISSWVNAVHNVSVVE